jgi:hypothetical protein
MTRTAAGIALAVAVALAGEAIAGRRTNPIGCQC